MQFELCKDMRFRQPCAVAFFLELYKNLYFRCQEVLGKLGIFGKKTSSN